MSRPVEMEMLLTRNDEEMVGSSDLPGLTTPPPPPHDDHRHEHTDEDMCSQCSDDDGSDYDEYEYCNCLVGEGQQPAPKAPGKRDIIPYKSVYDTQDEARIRGYWIPGVPATAKIVAFERHDSGRLFHHFIYTIELEHGSCKWTIQRRYEDFSHLNNRLMLHRAAERIRLAPKKAHDMVEEAIDNTLEHFGYDYIPEHKEDCPYNRQATQLSYDPHMRTLSKSTEGGDEVDANADKNGNGESSGLVPPVVVDGSSAAHDDAKAPASEENATSGDNVADHAAVSKSMNEGKKKRKKRKKKHRHLPSFPSNEMLMNESHINEKKDKLEAWLQAVLNIPADRNHHETARFLEVSRFSFINQLGGKSREGMVKKRPGGQHALQGWKHCCVQPCAAWSKRWLILKDSCVYYMDPDKEIINSVLLFDKHFKVEAGGQETGIQSGLLIQNYQRNLLLKCESQKQSDIWRKSINEMSRGRGKVWLEQHRFGSTYPIREHSYAQWFADGQTFMEQAASMMELAREEIFISDWWLSPEIYMKRPMMEGNRWRLDEILKRKAEQGVKIFVLLYKEMEVALGINSIYSKQMLQKLHDTNIRVLRHPDHLPGLGTFFWAHHEKLICIDQTVAFVGGIDLCYGRWDDCRHRLIDLGSVQFQNVGPLAGEELTLLSGMRAVAAASTSIQLAVDEEIEEIVDEIEKSKRFLKKKHTDEKLHSGSSKFNAIEGVNHDTPDKAEKADVGGTQEPKVKKKTQKRVSFESLSEPATSSEDNKNDHKQAHLSETVAEPRGKLKQFVKKKMLRSKSLEPPPVLLREAGPPMRLLSTAVTKMDIADAVERYKEYVESGRAEKEKRQCGTPPPEQQKKNKLTKVIAQWKTSRAKRRWMQISKEEEATGFGCEYELGWLRLQAEDVDETEVVGSGKIWLGKDYCNFVHKDFIDLHMPYHDFIDRAMTPRMPWHDIHSVTYGAAARDVARHFIQRWNACKSEKVKEDDDYPFLVPKSYENVKVPRVFRNISQQCNVQVLRSSSSWSAGVNCVEDSIQQAYLSMITNAQHYVYIENQFFVSMINSGDVHNEICKVLCDRIVRAYEQGETFRVYLMLPLLPGFEGQVGAPGGSALLTVLHWTYRSLSQGPGSLLENLKKKVPDPFQYLHVGSLRTCEELCGRLLTELVYIHSKLIIVDDTQCVIGSANINDRSQVGNRDSEVALFFEDCEFDSSTMNGQPYQAGKFASGLRKQLMREHLGVLDVQCDAPSKGIDVHTEDIDVSDPTCDAFFSDVWSAIATKNTELYEKVFRVYPTDLVGSFEQLSVWERQIPMSQYNKVQAEVELTELRGSLVNFPLYFLKDSNLAPSITTKEGLAPSAIFT